MRHQPSNPPDGSSAGNSIDSMGGGPRYDRTSHCDESPGDFRKHEEALPKIQPVQSEPPAPIAICGMGMRLPGGIRDERALYDFLVERKDARSVTPPSRYNVDAYYSPHGKPGTIVTKHGYFLDSDLAKFDPTTFRITATEAAHLDPNQRLALEVVREAFERAGETDWRGKKIGTYVGVFGEDWLDMRNKDANFASPYDLLGAIDYAIANRISYEYDLKGPSMTVKTACSSAAVGLHGAMQEIQSGNITSAIVVGANLIFAPGMTVAMSIEAALSPEGSSKSFDADADGYARGEAVTALYIKRLDEAIRDGNPIRAILRASSSNSDGKTAGFSTPSADAHEAAIREAYSMAHLDFSQTAMVETHGTGTPTGDPIEAEAIARCFGGAGVYLGAVKPNLGHSEGAAVITSLIKAVISLEHSTILPNIKFNTPNPAIPWDRVKLTVPVTPCPWPKDRAERISVNSYGIGGSNVHFILDSAASFGLGTPNPVPSIVNGQMRKKTLLVFSAEHPESIKTTIRNHEEYLSKYPDRLETMAYNLSEKRERLRYRSFCISSGSDPLTPTAPSLCRNLDQVAYVFTGQGAQWTHMGKELMADFDSFLANIRSMDGILQSLQHAPSWSIEDTISRLDDASILSRAEYSQTVCTALQIAFVDLLASWGVRPSAVIGHSSGEIAASYAAGSLSRVEAIIVAFYRGQACKDPPQKGGMAAIGLGKLNVARFLVPGVTIACENSPSSTTLAGDEETLEKVMADIKGSDEDIFVRRLQVEIAYHSDHMRRIGDKYRDLIAGQLDPRPPTVPFYSSTYGGKVLSKASQFGASYWQENLENPVLFNTAVKSMVSPSPQLALLEVGPHATLRGALRQITQSMPAPPLYIPTLSRGKSDTESFLSAMGQLFAAGIPIRVPSDPSSATVLPDLPTYAWHYDQSYWTESRVMSNWRFRKHIPHDLLGVRTLEGTELVPTWRNNLRLSDVPWLGDHRVGKDIVFPGAAYIAIAGEAALQLAESGVQDYSIRAMDLHQALILQDDAPTELVTTLRPQRLTSSLSSSNWYEFQISSYGGAQTWVKNCSGLVRVGRTPTVPSAFKTFKALPRHVSSCRWYETGARAGLNYGPRFTGLYNITAGVTEKISAADGIDNQRWRDESVYPLHPVTLDLALQAWTVALFRGDYRTFDHVLLPKFIGEVYVGNGTGRKIRFCSATSGCDAAGGQSYGLGEDGTLLFWLKDPVSIPLEQDRYTPGPMAIALEWKPAFCFMDHGKLTRPSYNIQEQLALVERLYVLCALESHIAINGISAAQPHLKKYQEWLGIQCARMALPGYILVEDSVELTQLSSAGRRDMISKVLDQCKASGCEAIGVAIWKTHNQLADVLKGETDFLNVMLNDGTLSNIYDWINDMWDVSDFFQLLGHMQPQMRILEIGAGTGGLTAKVLRHLRSTFGERLYFQYTFTDVSSGFFPAAKTRFKEYQAMEYKVLDISKSPLEQGFQCEGFDLIIASNVLHATPILHDTLIHVRTLLKPEGQLFLQELSPVTKCMGYIMGLFPGWWLGALDGRGSEPFLSPEEWDSRLRASGFGGCEMVTFDNVRPYHINANIVARPAAALEFEKVIGHNTTTGGAKSHQVRTKISYPFWTWKV
ncbi:hypothetical protein EDB80DRAFT_809883 [Ilyonectria destructans]|nr:hypothetical protein EDB80DRAFT_809883 [Ilyonectria destructans]